MLLLFYRPYLQIINQTHVPIVVVEHGMSNFMDALSNGATLFEVYDEIPERPESSIVLASKALIRRYLFDKYDVPYFGEEGGYAATLTKENLSEALVTMISKSEKARNKLEKGTWQHSMIESNLDALYIAFGLVAIRIKADKAG